MVGGCGFVVAAGLGAWAAGECSEECCLLVRVIASGIGWGVFGYKCWGLLRSSTNNKISVCGWCKFGFLFILLLLLFFFLLIW